MGVCRPRKKRERCCRKAEVGDGNLFPSGKQKSGPLNQGLLPFPTAVDDDRIQAIDKFLFKPGPYLDPPTPRPPPARMPPPLKPPAAHLPPPPCVPTRVILALR